MYIWEQSVRWNYNSESLFLSLARSLYCGATTISRRRSIVMKHAVYCEAKKKLNVYFLVRFCFCEQQHTQWTFSCAVHAHTQSNWVAATTTTTSARTIIYYTRVLIASNDDDDERTRDKERAIIIYKIYKVRDEVERWVCVCAFVGGFIYLYIYIMYIGI